MQQVLFWIPVKFSWFPDGIPLYAYGAMLFLCFVIVVWFTSRRAKKLGMKLPSEKVQDLAIALFIAGLAGARITYMWQFGTPWYKFFRIWEGGIVLQGGIIGGAIAFILFHRYVLRRFDVTIWQAGDLVAPALCIGIAIGRVGCLLNGCCWGNVAGPSCPSLEFPLLTSPSREMLVDKEHLQTFAGFLRDRSLSDDPRTIVGKVEPDSNAAKAGVKEGDRIDKINLTGEWQLNGEVLIFNNTNPEQEKTIETAFKDLHPTTDLVIAQKDQKDVRIFKITIEKPENFKAAQEIANRVANRPDVIDLFTDLLNNWPRGRNSVQFMVERDGQEVELPACTPRGLGLHPTQTYESISMILLTFLLLAFYPFRRHDGQVWVLFMIAYSIHRFLNESLRTEPIEAFGLTLAQNISVLTLLGAIALEIYIRKTQPRRV